VGEADGVAGELVPCIRVRVEIMGLIRMTTD
jgi:hypothetical protein